MRSTDTLLDRWPMNFKLTLQERVRAAAGIPAYMRRKRRIEDLEESILRDFEEAYEEALAEGAGDRTRAEASFYERAKSIDLRPLNDLIEKHNRYFPIEANLPLDVHTGRLMYGTQPWVPLELVTREVFIVKMRAARAVMGAGQRARR